MRTAVLVKGTSWHYRPRTQYLHSRRTRVRTVFLCACMCNADTFLRPKIRGTDRKLILL